MAKHADAAKEKLSGTDPADTSASPEPADEESPESVIADEEIAETAPSSETTEDETRAEEGIDADASGAEDDGESEEAAPARKLRSPVRLAMVAGSILVLSFGALAGWFGWQMHHSQQVREQRQQLVQVARQGALNLTTIDWEHADADIQRILDSATGTFYEDFSHRSKPFIEVVKKAQSKSVGTITDAGLESQSGNEAQVLVAVSVKTSNIGAAEQDSRHWRMRVTVQKVGNEEKVSNVVFVP
jgi:Mce-associated membrane protein